MSDGEVFVRISPGSEICAKCGAHVRNHFGGTEYRCYPKNVDAAEMIYTGTGPSVQAQRIAELEAEVTRLHLALDAWLDWDRTAESDTSAAILERARTLTEEARR